MMDFDTYAMLFVPFWAIAFPFLLVGVLTGIIGAANAWVGDFETARRLGWNCAVPGGIVGSLLLAASAAIGVPYPWIFALPALLGGLALLHAHYFRDMPPPDKYQFTIPMIFYATLLSAIVVVGITIILTKHVE